MKKYGSVFICLIVFIFGTVSAGKSSRRTIQTNAFGQTKSFSQTVILDAGHGGEDGGAVASDGTVEKDINLVISNGIAACFELFGIPYIPVRTDDRSVCDEGLLTIRERKRSDIMNRFSLVNDTDNAILLSIHQNYYTEERYYGTQIFYSPNDAASQVLAGFIKTSVYHALQPRNTRESKPSTNSVYLLYYAKKPSVMVECGFLSNTAEREKLLDRVYDSQMSYYIFRGMLNYLNS